jgi:hypothetical protein
MTDQLSEEEISQMRDVFNFLYHGLRKAKQRFNSDVQNGGRDGAVHALEYVLKFFDALQRTGIYPLILAEALNAPLSRLCDDLMSLDDGKVSVMLKPKKTRGRARGSTFYEGLKAIAVFTVRRLEATGMQPTDARKAVAKHSGRARCPTSPQGLCGERRVQGAHDAQMEGRHRGGHRLSYGAGANA